MKHVRVRQIGSVHAVIILLLVVALIGALGVVFYQNFIANKMRITSVNDENQSKSEVSLKTVRAAFGSKIYAFDYPSNWLVITEPQSDGSQQITLKNPDKSIRVTIALQNSSPNRPLSVCDSNSSYKLRYYTVGKTPVAKLSDTSAYVTVAMTDAVDGGYNYSIGLTEDGGATHATVGDPSCTVDTIGWATRAVRDGSTVTQPFIAETIDFPKLAIGTDYRVKEMQIVKDLLATNDYRAAVKILESSRKE